MGGKRVIDLNYHNLRVKAIYTDYLDVPFTFKMEYFK